MRPRSHHLGERRGPISDVVARTVTRLGGYGRPSHPRRQMLGVVTAVSVPAVWLWLLWTGFALMFLSDDDVVLVAATQRPVEGLGRLAYAAGGLAGAGAGLVAGTATWQLVNNASALAGLALVTLSLTYLMQVVSAMVNERSVMSQVAALAPHPDEALQQAMGPPGGGTLPLQLVLIGQGISEAAQRHLAFPMLQYFHGSSRATAAPANLARYHAVLAGLEQRTGAEHRPTIIAGRAAVEDFLGTLRLQDVPKDADRREKVSAFLEQEGWTWDDVADA